MRLVVVETKDGGSYEGVLQEIDENTVLVVGKEEGRDKEIKKSDIARVYND